MKISNLLKISTLCCTVLCGVSNNTCNAGKSNNYENNVGKLIFGGKEKYIVQQQNLLPEFENIVIYNGKEAIRFVPERNKVLYYTNKINKKTLKNGENLLKEVKRVLENKNIDSLRGLKGRLPSRYEFYQFVKKNRLSSLKPLTINVTIKDQIKNLTEDQPTILEDNGRINKLCEIDNIFQSDLELVRVKNIIPIQMLFPVNKTISITNDKNIIFYKNGNIKSYYFTDSDDDGIKIDDLRNYITVLNLLLADNYENADYNSTKSSIKLAVKETFGKDYKIYNL